MRLSVSFIYFLTTCSFRLIHAEDINNLFLLFWLFLVTFPFFI